MPFAHETTPFTGDDDLGDFMLDVWLPFARDNCGWVDNQAPAVGTRPNVEIWTHRGTDLAREAPYFFARTTDRDMYLFTGTGVDTGEEIYDQPGNPANAPASADFVTPSDVVNMRCAFLNSVVGPYEAYWLFCDTSGAFVHCVIKVNSRQYRHFHIGLFNPLHSDLDDEAFYMTGHFWVLLDPERYLNDGPHSQFTEHDVYSVSHRAPFGWGTANATSSFSPRQQFASKYYLPGLNLDADWYLGRASDLRIFADAAVKSIGDVNTSVQHGVACCSGWGSGLGAILFAADKTFTSGMVPLVPVYVSAAVDFEGQPRHGVVAQVPDVFRINVRDIAPETEIIVGGETYVVFPLINSDSQNTLEFEGYSGYEGLAYRKETGAVV